MPGKILPKLTYANVMATIAVFLALGGGAIAATSFIGEDGRLQGCVGKKGRLTVVKPEKRCPKRTTRIAWNQQGPAGRDGTNGANGQDGTNGANGRDATPVDFAAEPKHAVADATGSGCQPDHFCFSGGILTGGTWRNYGNGYAGVGYWRDKTGVVHLEGIAQPLSGGESPPATIFYLPAGYRPAAIREFTVRGCGGVVDYVDVHPDGRVNAGDVTRCMPLDGISFRR